MTPAQLAAIKADILASPDLNAQGEMVPTQPTIAIGQRVQIKSFNITRGSA